MNLYEINAALLTTFDEETGEIFDTEKMNQLEMDRAEKITNIVHFIKNLEADAEALKKEAQTFTDRKKACENKAEALKKYLTSVLNGEKFESEDKTAKITWRKSESVNLTVDVWNLPEEYKRYKAPEAKLDEIKRALKDGVKIEGAELVTNNNIQIK